MASQAVVDAVATRPRGGRFVPLSWGWIPDAGGADALPLHGSTQRDFNSNQGGGAYENMPTTVFGLPALMNEAMSMSMSMATDGGYSYQTLLSQQDSVTNIHNPFSVSIHQSVDFRPLQWQVTTPPDAPPPAPAILEELPLLDFANESLGNYDAGSMALNPGYYNHDLNWDGSHGFVTSDHQTMNVGQNLPSTLPFLTPLPIIPNESLWGNFSNEGPGYQPDVDSLPLDMSALENSLLLHEANPMPISELSLVGRPRAVDAAPQFTFKNPMLPGSPTPTTAPPETPNRISRKRPRSPLPVANGRDVRGKTGKFEGMSVLVVSQPSNRKLTEEQKADRKRKKLFGTCNRCKRLKQKCNEFRESPYLPCVSCRKSQPRAITTACILEASLIGINLFRMGPPVDNPTFPLNFSLHRPDILHLEGSNGPTLSETLNLELMQDNVGFKLHLKVSRFSPLLDDKLAYEGMKNNVPYNLTMPPYCISNIEDAKQSIVNYMCKAKVAYINQFVDKTCLLLHGTFSIAAESDFMKRPLVDKALDIGAATRLIERTWKICGNETLGIHPYRGRNDPWVGYVPVTPIMDQQLDQVVIQEVLLPRKKALLRLLSDKIYDEKARKTSIFEIYLTLFILLNNSEMQVAAERSFADTYGFSGRFGPRGKYMDAEAQFHAARTMLGHFHYICRGSSLLRLSDTQIRQLGVTVKEKQYLDFLKKQVEQQDENFTSLIKDSRYESSLYFCHQMFANEWDPGNGHIAELPELSNGTRKEPSSKKDSLPNWLL